jgi:hypothetical protein
MNLKIVISRYNENLEWILPYEDLFVVYNKGDNNINYIKDYKNLDNIGRESHTYIQYIIDNYDNLPDYVMFLQGNPFDHTPDILDKINYYNNNNDNFDFKFLSHDIIKVNLSGCKHHPNLPLIGVYFLLFGELIGNLNFEFGRGAQFIVNKNNILKKEKSFYEKIILLLEHSVCPIEGFVFERFWKLIFTK